MLEVIYRVVMLMKQTGKWETWTNYTTLDDAVNAAAGLVVKPAIARIHILEITPGCGRIVAEVGLDDHGRPYVRKIGS